MAARKLAQEIEKEYKTIALGIAAFDGVYEKLSASQNSSQREKLEDSLKKEIKKLQRSRDKVKTWATSSEIKNKTPLVEQRKLIETRMETFKMVEKEMKTKAFSKEGLSAAAKLDPKEREKLDVSNFISEQVDALGLQTEAFEAEIETLHAATKKGKKDTGKADRLSELERTVEKHKEHTSKLEIILRGVENGSIDVEQVSEIKDEIKHYVENNQEVDFEENEWMYEGLNLEEEEDLWGMNKEDGERGSSQDAQSVADDTPDLDIGAPPAVKSAGPSKGKSASISETPGQSSARRSSTQHAKSPLPALSTLHSSLPANVLAGKPVVSDMKPAPLPTIPTGQPLKYASAAAAAASSVGIAPLPPPPGGAHKSNERPLSSPSPTATPAQPAEPIPQPSKPAEKPAPREEPPRQAEVPKPATRSSSKAPSVAPSPHVSQAQPARPESSSKAAQPQPPSPDSGVAGMALSNGTTAPEEEEEEEESIYHLPSSLTDLLDSFEETKSRVSANQPFDPALLQTSRTTAPIPSDASKPSHYTPLTPYPYTPAHYPTTPLPIFSDPALYSRIDTDSLFYAFYYRQGTYQQYLAAKALKGQSWRFHKQYQTWFQRHEEPKRITEEFEEGAYRFFDYESTWMNRRKADFKFAYKFLEDDL
ncbi:general negative regulator of transcription subunit 5 [Elasticomyces elasticus]|uniref:General negative regulator of transcription subunit n=1 Tax=Elasticomyces elasticus TaxID=574655 RepID=A0AAN7VWV4_9PEZI|nr:general negative regulator of transcription subunit 5 [Elasticomyces elasticus]